MRSRCVDHEHSAALMALVRLGRRRRAAVAGSVEGMPLAGDELHPPDRGAAGAAHASALAIVERAEQRHGGLLAFASAFPALRRDADTTLGAPSARVS